MHKLFALIFTVFIFSKSIGQENIATIADSLYESKQYSELIKQAEFHLENKKPDVYTSSLLKYLLGNSYYKSGNFVNGWKLMQEAYENVKNINLTDTINVELFVDVAQRLGDYSFLAEEYEIGVSTLNQAIKIGNERLPGDAWRLAKLYHKAGAILRVMTQFDEAISHLDKGKSYIPKMAEDRGKYFETVILAEMAQVYNDKNQLKKAIEIFKSILKAAYEEDNKKRISIYNNNIAIAYERKGDYGKSEYHFKKSLEAKFDLYGEKTPKIIANYTNLARVNALLKRHKVADDYHKKLEKLLSEVFEKDHTKNGDIQYNIGTSYFEQKLYPKALTHLKEAVRIWKLHKPEGDLTLAEAQHLLGATYSRLGMYNEAIPILNKTLKARSAAIETQDTERKRILTSLYETYIGMDKESKALPFLDLAFEAINFSKDDPFAFDKIENPLGLVDPLSLKLSYLSDKLKENHVEEYVNEGQFISTVCDSLIQFVKFKYDDIGTRRIATTKIQDLNEAMLQFNFEVHKFTKDKSFISNAFRIIERSNNTFLYEAIAEENSKNKFGLPQVLYERKTVLQDSITSLHNKLELIPLDIRTQSKLYAESLSKLNSYKSNLYALVKKIETEHPKYFESIYKHPMVSLEEVQSKLSKDEVILSYFNGYSNVYGLLITHNNLQFNSLGRSKKISKEISAFLETLKSRSINTPYLNSSKILHNTLIAPFNIPKKASISIIADDALSLLPFEILIDEYTNLPMLLSHVITYQYSNTLSINSNSNTPGKGSIAMAPIFENNTQPLYAQNFNSDDRYRSEVGFLPDSRNEVNAIHSLLKGEVRIGENASEAEFKSIAPGKALLHLATHGFVDHSNPDFSRLYFNSRNDSIEDGLLHAHEIVNMNLSADLVTLSACNTGIGKIQNGEGVSSLGRAFAYANCPNQLISLWPANDKSTTELMTHYYKNLTKGMGKSKALTEAKRQYLSTAPELYKHPYYWAGFVYYGQDKPLILSSSLSKWIIIFSIGLALLLLYSYRNKILSPNSL